MLADPLPDVMLTAVRVLVSPGSGSVSFARTSTIRVAFSSATLASGFATGAALVRSKDKDTVAVSVSPSASVMR